MHNCVGGTKETRDVFLKPNEQNRACSSYAMARKRRMKSNLSQKTTDFFQKTREISQKTRDIFQEIRDTFSGM